MGGKRKIHIGTSGWDYEHWRGPFYPLDLPKRQLLPYYARRFETVEINSSFYRLPSKETMVRWGESTQEGFLFAVKANRFITHMKKLKEPHRTLRPFLDTVAALGRKLGPILFQLPPRLGFDAERFDLFLFALPEGLKYALEFRDPSWFNHQAYEAMAEKGVAFCIFDLAGFQSPMEVTGELVYVRLHGPEGAYRGRYSDRVLGVWADAIHTWVDRGKEVYCYFDNDEAGYAAQDARRLKQLLSFS
ncbi:MAG: DUF72 domain-containing protein [Thermodesulfobacteriota bacterium]